MQAMKTYKAAQTVVVGLGASGLACLRHLQRRGIPVAVTDSRAQPPGRDDARRLLGAEALHLGGIDAALLGDAAEVVLSPGISPEEPAVAAAARAGIPVVGEVELFARVARAPVVAITGSNGKSTVTTLVGDMARAAGRDVAVGGNLGTPALDLLRDPEPALYVLELSSFQLETLHSLEPVAATVLNISADHLDRHHSLERYAAIKARIFNGRGTLVLNRDDTAVRDMLRPGRPVRWFGAGDPQGDDHYGLRRRDGAVRLCRGEIELIPAAELRIQGRHNLVNALAALALADAAGLPLEPALAALRAFPGLPHRMQWVAQRAGMDWINDSKATNVGATLAAVEGTERPLVLIAGGDGKGADFTPLAVALRDRARAVVLLGRDAPRLADALAGSVPCLMASDMADAVQQAAAAGQPGDLVLLSPACASLDMYPNYMVRGDAFTDAVGRLPA